MTGKASIIVRIVENWNAFIILHVILDFFTFYYKRDSICKAFTNL